MGYGLRTCGSIAIKHLQNCQHTHQTLATKGTMAVVSRPAYMKLSTKNIYVFKIGVPSI